MLFIIPNRPDSQHEKRALTYNARVRFGAYCGIERAISALFSDVFRHCGIGGRRTRGPRSGVDIN